eukprot:3166692-Alexandrium_andersonii.AAC.1
MDPSVLCLGLGLPLLRHEAQDLLNGCPLLGRAPRPGDLTQPPDCGRDLANGQVGAGVVDAGLDLVDRFEALHDECVRHAPIGGL